jgi:hypothetical protein
MKRDRSDTERQRRAGGRTPGQHGQVIAFPGKTWPGQRANAPGPDPNPETEGKDVEEGSKKGRALRPGFEIDPLPRVGRGYLHDLARELVAKPGEGAMSKMQRVVDGLLSAQPTAVAGGAEAQPAGAASNDFCEESLDEYCDDGEDEDEEDEDDEDKDGWDDDQGEGEERAGDEEERDELQHLEVPPVPQTRIEVARHALAQTLVAISRPTGPRLAEVFGAASSAYRVEQLLTIVADILATRVLLEEEYLEVEKRIGENPTPREAVVAAARACRAIAVAVARGDQSALDSARTWANAVLEASEADKFARDDFPDRPTFILRIVGECEGNLDQLKTFGTFNRNDAWTLAVVVVMRALCRSWIHDRRIAHLVPKGADPDTGEPKMVGNLGDMREIGVDFIAREPAAQRAYLLLLKKKRAWSRRPNFTGVDLARIVLRALFDWDGKQVDKAMKFITNRERTADTKDNAGAEPTNRPGKGGRASDS